MVNRSKVLQKGSNFEKSHSNVAKDATLEWGTRRGEMGTRPIYATV